MKQGQISRSFFCSFCGAPAVGARASRMRDPFVGYWANGCAHAGRPVRMGPKRRAEVVAANERRKQAQREYIATCLGEPIDAPTPIDDAGIPVEP